MSGMFGHTLIIVLGSKHGLKRVIERKYVNTAVVFWKHLERLCLKTSAKVDNCESSFHTNTEDGMECLFSCSSTNEVGSLDVYLEYLAMDLLNLKEKTRYIWPLVLVEYLICGLA